MYLDRALTALANTYPPSPCITRLAIESINPWQWNLQYNSNFFIMRYVPNIASQDDVKQTDSTSSGGGLENHKEVRTHHATR